MARQKRNSIQCTKAATRLASIKSINPELDLGHGLTTRNYETAIADLQNEVNAYNTLLSHLDEKLNIIKEKEKRLVDLSERMLAGIAAKYSKNSDEYEMAGGVKKTERKKFVRKTAKAI